MHKCKYGEDKPDQYFLKLAAPIVVSYMFFNQFIQFSYGQGCLCNTFYKKVVELRILIIIGLSLNYFAVANNQPKSLSQHILS